MHGNKSSSINHGCKTHLLLYFLDYIKFFEISEKLSAKRLLWKIVLFSVFSFFSIRPLLLEHGIRTRLEWMVEKNSISYFILKSIYKNFVQISPGSFSTNLSQQM